MRPSLLILPGERTIQRENIFTQQKEEEKGRGKARKERRKNGRRERKGSDGRKGKEGKISRRGRRREEEEEESTSSEGQSSEGAIVETEQSQRIGDLSTVIATDRLFR